MRYFCLFFFMLNCQVKKSNPIKVNSEIQSDIKKVNSQKLKLPSGKILKGEERKQFELDRIKIDLKLAELR